MKRFNTMSKITVVSLIVTLVAGCAAEDDKPQPESAIELIEVARSERQWTGVAVSHEGRIFVNYPRWSDNVPFTVGEVTPDGAVTPYPDEKMNRWDSSLPPGEHFIGVQSVYIDSGNFLWVLDPGNPQFTGVIPGGAKLVKFDLKTDSILRTYTFGPDVVTRGSYLNDVRVDTELNYAYISDSDAGGIVVVDLDSGQARRLLADHSSALSEGITLTVGGKEWLRPDGTPPSVHTDGIALTSDGKYVYYQALSGRTLYRIESRWLRDESLSADELGSKVETVAKSGAADGIAFGPDGALYLSAIEEDAVNRLTPDGRVETVIKSPRLLWPDSFSITPDGVLYVSTSQIHLGANRTEPYMVYKLEIE